MKIIGHRGAKGEAPENTLNGIQHAVEAGAKHIEIDIRLSADKHLVLLHDACISRTTQRVGQIYTLKNDSIIRLDARHSIPDWAVPAYIPMLESIIPHFPELESYQLEVKSDAYHRLVIIARRLAHTIRKLRVSEQAIVTSLDIRFLRLIKHFAPELKRGYVANSSYLAPVQTALKLKCDYLCINQKIISPKLVKDAHWNGLEVSAWTVNSIDRAEQLKQWGVDSVITDYPTLFLKHFS